MFTVLHVCTGNICRSAMAQLFLVDRLPVDAPVRVTSAGTHGLTGWGVDGPSARAVGEYGIDPSGHSARRLTADLVTAADLVLGATLDHRAAVTALVPGAAARTFTLREFAAVSAATPVSGDRSEAGMRAQMAAVDARRGHLIHAAPANIADPYGGTLEEARRCAAQISAAVDEVLRALSLR